MSILLALGGVTIAGLVLAKAVDEMITRAHVETYCAGGLKNVDEKEIGGGFSV